MYQIVLVKSTIKKSNSPIGDFLIAPVCMVPVDDGDVIPICCFCSADGVTGVEEVCCIICCMKSIGLGGDNCIIGGLVPHWLSSIVSDGSSWWANMNVNKSGNISIVWNRLQTTCKGILYHNPSKTFTFLCATDLLPSCGNRHNYYVLNKDRKVNLQKMVHCTNIVHVTY